MDTSAVNGITVPVKSRFLTALKAADCRTFCALISGTAGASAMVSIGGNREGPGSQQAESS